MSISYAPNERVLCYHGPLIYEAKVLKAENWDERTSKAGGATGPHYFVHYKGWKQTWDEWAPATRVLKFNEENIAIQKNLQASAANASAASTSKGKPGVGGSAAGGSASVRGGDGRGGAAGRKDGRGTKRGREEDEGSKKPEMKLSVPEILKVKLVDDWEAVTKNNQLVPVPRTPTVLEILEDFSLHARSMGKNSNLREPDLLTPTIISGLQVYFDKSLGANLLYRFERPQYAEIRRTFITGPKVIVGQEKEMSAIYGAEHLLRMLVSLPQMVATSTMDPESVTLVRDYVNELLSWMVQERERLFVKEYESASLQYQNISKA
ncbi:MRG-domain-containing protein [Athelia psychrophila]|uniref:Chromatin modification-related protein EAF3 n=1 Tax=Athelia psychrophila TaxID=1759441 RepID=A0A166MR47_9AGAM|nr:MRG-domain-containing protein [Fibularhizoctonia sp. CBS 109695]